MARIWWIGLAAALGALAAYLLLWPVPIEPASWSPPKAPELAGVYMPNEALAGTVRIEVGFAPESVTVDASGRVYAGLEDGSIVRWVDGGVEVIAELDGRALGMGFDADGSLIACDLNGRLLSIDEEGVVDLVSEVDGRPLGLVNDLDLGEDGTIYFSESSTETTDTLLDLLEHRGNGRLLSYDPTTAETTVLLDGLFYANGVAVSADGAFVLVVETTWDLVWRRRGLLVGVDESEERLHRLGPRTSLDPEGRRPSPDRRVRRGGASLRLRPRPQRRRQRDPQPPGPVREALRRDLVRRSGGRVPLLRKPPGARDRPDCRALS